MSRSPTEAVGAELARDYEESFGTLGRMILEGGSLSGRERHCLFLNTRGSRFGNISAVSGLDFPDDGRGLAVVDWDHDGDLDVWLSNRTGPQVRFMRNDTASDAHFLAVRLTGRSCNRDGIGARLELVLKDRPRQKLVKSLRAGEGYLSQSSKWIHFGLGPSTGIDRLTVRWPGGREQTFRGLVADRRYQLTQGSDRAEVWAPPGRRLSLKPKKLDSPAAGRGGTRSLLSVRAPLGSLTYPDFDGRQRSLEEFQGGPVLLNLWASWCPPCIRELGEFTGRQHSLRQSGLSIVALSVDALDDGGGQPLELLAKLKFPFASGRAGPRLLHRLEMIRNRLFAWRQPFAVPTSFLIDARGWLAAIYTGPVKVDQLLEDLQWLSGSTEPMQSQTLPFPGRWLTPVSPISKDRWNRELAGAYYNVGLDLAKSGRFGQAVEEYRQALALNPQDAKAHHNLGAAYAQQGRLREAITQYRQVLRIRPDSVEARSNLGVILAQQGRRREAISQYREALRLNPGHPGVLNALATTLVTGRGVVPGDAEEAARLAERACELTGYQQPLMLDTLAIAYGAAGRVQEAVTTAQQALQLAQANGQTRLVAGIKQRLVSYRQRLR